MSYRFVAVLKERRKEGRKKKRKKERKKERRKGERGKEKREIFIPQGKDPFNGLRRALASVTKPSRASSLATLQREVSQLWSPVRRGGDGTGNDDGIQRLFVLLSSWEQFTLLPGCIKRGNADVLQLPHLALQKPPVTVH